VQAIGHGRIDLDDPAVILALLEQNAVDSVTSFFDSWSIAQARYVRAEPCLGLLRSPGPEGDRCIGGEGGPVP
jgi:hypothetical protein